MTVETARGAATKKRLQEAALQLFVEKGYDNTTVEEIAARAGLSHMTFFRYFPTKESVILDDPYDPAIASAVSATNPSLTPIERVKDGLALVARGIGSSLDSETRTRIRIAADNPRLRAGMWENNRRTEEALVEALTSTGVAEFDAHVAAGACLGALMAALLSWGTGDTDESLGDLIERALDQVVPS